MTYWVLMEYYPERRPSNKPLYYLRRSQESRLNGYLMSLPHPLRKNCNQTRPGPPTGTDPPTYYPPSIEVPCKFIAEMISTDSSCPRFHFNKTNESPGTKLHQEVRCPTIEKRGYVYKNNLTEAAKIVDRFNHQFPKPHPSDIIIKDVCRATEDSVSEDAASTR